MSLVNLAKVDIIVMMMRLVTCSNTGISISALQEIIVHQEPGCLLNVRQALIQMMLSAIDQHRSEIALYVPSIIIAPWELIVASDIHARQEHTVLKDQHGHFNAHQGSGAIG